MTRPLSLLLIPVFLGACVVRIGEPEPVTYGSVPTSFSAVGKKDLSASLELEPGEALHLATSFGGIRVKTSEQTTPFVTAALTLHAETMEEARRTLAGYRLETVRDESGLVVRLIGEPPVTRGDEGTETTRSPSVELDAVVPEGTPLLLESSSGEIVVTGPLGLVRARTSFGDVSVTDVAGADLATSSGDVTVEGVSGGDCRISASFGDIEVEGRLSGLDAVASTGDVTVSATRGSRVATPWRVSSSFGDATLTLPEGMPCAVEARTAFGSLDTNLEGVRTDTVSGASLSAVLSGGGERVTVETSSGDVEVRVR